ncbi:uncharacterized protein LOC131146818 isoform X2 [Malania oleifera]|uniref:uncharacterized protein LOC131146818 isoform X2 n=1 Tax=Malania oleifera TaxID=397392 RepID=UPI0025AE7C74|nr:uncharacterized protein LOC131146818 isoform X2 [Malania oleifera]
MPGPGPHMMYALGSAVGLTSVSGGRFGPHHSLTYALNAFFGPDIGSFAEWLASTFARGGSSVSSVAELIHDPFYYILILGFPLSLLYSWVSRVLLQRGFLDSFSGAPLNRRQCLFLISAGSLSHFFLDHLFENHAGFRFTPQCAGKWAFVHVYLDFKHGLVERPSTHQSRCCCCHRLFMLLLNWWLHIYQQGEVLKVYQKTINSTN